MALAGNVIARVGADIRPFQRGLRGSQRDLNQWQRGMNRSLNTVKFAVKAATIAMGIAFAYATKESINLYKTQFLQEKKLEVIMKQRMNATQDMIQEIKNLTSEQQILGVVGDEVQLAGVQQLATFLKTTDSLKKLIPSLNNLAAQQKGLDATGSDLVNIANMFGKVLDGQVGALKRVGISFSKAQEKVLKYGTESQRASTLAQVVTDNVGEMNEALANTPLGRWQQVKNSFGDLLEEIGKAIVPLRDLMIPVFMILISLGRKLAITIQNLANQFSQLTTVLFGSNEKQKNNVKSAISAAKAQIDLGKATKKAGAEAKRGVAGFDEVNQLQEKMVETAETGETAMTGSTPNLDTDATGTTGGLLSADATRQIEEFRNKFINAFKEIKDFLTANKEPIIAAITAITTAIVLLKLTMNFEVIVSALKLMGSAIATIFAAISTPVLIVIGVIAVLTGAFTYLWRTNETFRNLITNIWQGIKTFFIDFWQNVLVPLSNWIGSTFVMVWGKIGQAALWFQQNVLVPLSIFFRSFLDNVLMPVASVISGVLAIAFDVLSRVALLFYQSVLVPLAIFFGGIFKPLIETISTVLTFLWQEVIVPLATYTSEVLTPTFETFGNTLTWLWLNVLQPIAVFIGNVFVTTFKIVFQTIGRIIKDLEFIFTNFLNFITNIFKGNWSDAWENIKNIFKGVSNIMVDILKGVQNAFSNIIHFIMNTFTNNWRNIWENVKDIFKGVFNSLYGIVKTPLNLIIDAVNKMINGLNKINIKVPSWVSLIPGVPSGISSFGFSIPTIPKLARGGIVSSPTLSMIGEAGTEAVVPLENTSFIDTLAGAIGNAVLAAMQFNQPTDSSSGDVVLNIDSTELARVIIPAINKENKRIGNTIIQGVG